MARGIVIKDAGAATRGSVLFPDLPEPEAPVERLAPGQPGKGWRRWGPDGWAFDCADGRKATTGNGTTRVVFYPAARGTRHS